MTATRLSPLRPSLAAQATLLSLAAGLAVRFNALLGDLRGDDFVQAAMLGGAFPGKRAVWDLFRFAGPTGESNAALVDFGYLPWWSSPDLSLAMFRPLASLLVSADHALFGKAPWLFHTHSMLWWMATIVLAGRLLFRLLPPAPAACALVIFALDEGHNVPVAWLANRSTLVATALGLLAVEAHLHLRERGGMRAHALLWLSLVLTVSAGEYALSVLCYPLACEVMSPGRPLARVKACLPALIVGGGYVVLRASLGHGVTDSGFYLGPFSDPWTFARAAVLRVPVMIADLTFGLPAVYWHNGPPWRAWMMSLDLLSPETWRRLPSARSEHVALGYVALAAFLALGHLGRRGLLAHGRGPAARALSWLALGAILGLIPAASAIPEDRVTVASSLGASGLLGTALWHGATLARRGRWAAWPLVLLIAAAHLGWAPVRDHERVGGFSLRSHAQRDWSLAAELPSDNAGHQRVYLFGPADFTTAANLPFVRWYHGLPLPKSYRRLSGSSLPHDLTRLSERELQVMAHGGALPGTMAGSLYRPIDRPIKTGDHFELPGLKIHIKAAWGGNPVTMVYAFDRSLDHPSLWFVHASHKGLRRIKPPGVGEMLRIDRAAGR
ncbi:MAG: hypothetical protein OXR73_16000 [Myxococcales bacterium]|nr:hypothetical protein [Myxococcales bacterium]